MQIASRANVARDAAWIAERTGGWSAATLLARCAFFVLGIFGAGLIATVFNLLHVPHFLLLSGLLLVGAAEWLVVKRRFFAAGIEEALELAGLLIIAFDVLDVQAGPSSVRVSLLITLMLLIAGLRLLNPLFITLSALAFSWALGFMWEHPSRDGMPDAAAAGAYCMALSWMALYINRVAFRRPSYDQIFNWLAVTMPVAAFLWFETQHLSALSNGPWAAGLSVRWLAVAMLIAFGLTALVVGIRRRTHAPILAFMACVGCIAYELRDLTTLPLHVKLLGGGSLVLFLTIALDRYLRTPRRGITSNEFEENKGSLELLQIAGVGGLTPLSPVQPDAQFKGAGGNYGGGGASGRY